MNKEQFIIFKEEIKKIIGQEIELSLEIKQNGESSILITGNSDTNSFSYIYAQEPENELASWQSAHFHNHIVETWIVEKGIMIVYENVLNSENTYEEIIIKPGDIYTSKVGVSHNYYLLPGTITHTINISVDNHSFEGDWYLDEKLDEFTKKINMEELIDFNELEEYL